VLPLPPQAPKNMARVGTTRECPGPC
jgi:hypothetical protein